MDADKYDIEQREYWKLYRLKKKQENNYKFKGNKDVNKIVVVYDNDSSSSSSSGSTGSELTDEPTDE
jgi:hypothetical protein